MEAAHPGQSQDFNTAPNGSLRKLFADSAHFWELRRLLYNLALVIVVLLWTVLSWPHFRPAFVPSTLLPLGALGLIANAFYCAAYLLDIPLLLSPFSAEWKRRRWILWTIGTLFAILLANYWIADEIYPFVR